MGYRTQSYSADKKKKMKKEMNCRIRYNLKLVSNGIIEGHITVRKAL